MERARVQVSSPAPGVGSPEFSSQISRVPPRPRDARLKPSDAERATRKPPRTQDKKYSSRSAVGEAGGRKKPRCAVLWCTGSHVGGELFEMMTGLWLLETPSMREMDQRRR